MSYLLKADILKRNRKFLCLFLSMSISFWGSMVVYVALPYQVYHLTQSTLMVGFLSVAQLIPLLFTALIGGSIADRCNRKKLLIIAELLLFIVMSILAWNAFRVIPSISLIFILSATASAILGFHRPAFTSLAQHIVAVEDYRQMSTLLGMARSTGMIVGPAIGGLVIAHVGLPYTFIIDAISFLISILFILSLRHLPEREAKTHPSAWQSIKEGLHYATTKQTLMGSYSIDFIAMIFGMPNALFPAIAQSFGGASVLGFLYSAPAIGALLASLFSGWVHKIKRYGLSIAVSAALWGLAIIFFGLSNNLYLGLIFLAFAGGADAISAIFRNTLWNETIPNDLRGRLSGIEMISYLSGPRLGDAEAGIVAAFFGVTFSVVSGGVLCVLGVIACGYYFPKLMQFQSTSTE